jgi:hypothetical protein
MPLLFQSSFGLRLNVQQVVTELIRFIKAEPKFSYKIVIGTDSQQLLNKRADFVTAVVIHRVSNGGRYFWRRFNPPAGGGKFHTLRDRIIQEVLLSLEVAREVLIELKKEPAIINWDFEIHADIGENGETKTLIQEVVGIIRANNFEAKTKPDSYAATKVADRHV